MAQWVKYPTVVAWVAMESQVQSPAQLQWVKGSAVATAMTWVTAVAQIQSLAQNFQISWIQLWKKKKLIEDKKAL